MRYYLAPLEGITGYIFRNAYHHCFHPMDKYFTPFLVPHINKDFNAREKGDILPEHNQGMYLVPQILTINSEDFLRTANRLKEYGYKEVNLNLGCPSKTVVSKGRGAGLLDSPDKVDKLLYEIFENTDLKVSVKTRLGMSYPEEFSDLLKVYNKYPFEELIVHARVQEDYYKKPVRRETFAEAIAVSENPLCYNGDLFTAENVKEFANSNPKVDCVMLGRGILRNPGLIHQLETGKKTSKETLRKFHDEIYENYKSINDGPRNTLFKMKELWFYFIKCFPENKKAAKKIKKSQGYVDYEIAVNELFSSL